MDVDFPKPVVGLGLEMFLKALSQAMDGCGIKIKPGNSAVKGQKAGKKMKAHFCVGINHVTRILERMPGKHSRKPSDIAGQLAEFVGSAKAGPVLDLSRRNKPIVLQAVIVATDVQPKKLVSHIAYLCRSRGVPVVAISGGDGMGSVRLGNVLGVRTAVVVGLKSGVSPIQKAVQAVLNR